MIVYQYNLKSRVAIALCLLFRSSALNKFSALIVFAHLFISAAVSKPPLSEDLVMFCPYTDVGSKRLAFHATVH